MIDLSNLFTPSAIVRRLKEAPQIVTPVMDIVFNSRPQVESPIIGAETFTQVMNTVPLIRRGGQSVPASSESASYQFYEPLAFRPSALVTGQDLNNLRMFTATGREQWASAKQGMLLNIVRRSTEAMCAVALGGSLSWAVKLEGGGSDTYEVVYGTPLSVTPNALWSVAETKISSIFDDLQSMEEKLQEKGYGSTIEFWAGKSAYLNLMARAEDYKSTAKLRVEISGQGINIGGYLVKRRAEKYQDPMDPATLTSVVADTEIKAVATDGGHQMPYAAVDDLKAGLRAMPFFVKAIEQEDPSGYKLIAESKPFPIVNVNAICSATVTA